jgi:hypothetical protein
VTGIDDVRAAAGFTARHPALTVQCPHCRAAVGDPCIGPASKRRLAAPHPSRLTAGPDADVIPIHRPPQGAWPPPAAS